MQLKTEVVTFRDKKQVTVSEENWNIGTLLTKLNEDAAKEPVDNVNDQVFRQVFYPKLAACSSGDVPSEEEAKQMPSMELDKWYEAVRRVNPQWFAGIDALMSKQDVEKKKVRKRRK